MDEALAWLRQAQSDLEAAKTLQALGRHDFYCHVIAKSQQTVEKSVKGLVAGLHAKGIVSFKTGFKHDVLRHISAIIKSGTPVSNQIAKKFSSYQREQIRRLEKLTPRRPSPGTATTRNTEYPYWDLNGGWIAPADKSTFSGSDADLFLKAAKGTLETARRTIQALSRTP